jgi:hypothetical protein
MEQALISTPLDTYSSKFMGSSCDESEMRLAAKPARMARSISWPLLASMHSPKLWKS